MLVDPGERATPNERAEYVRSILGTAHPGSHERSHERLVELFGEDPDPGPIDVYRTWHGVEPGSGDADADGFDPATDDAPTASKVRVKQTYEQAVEEGLDDAAAFLRSVRFNPHQRGFAMLLRRGGYLADDGGG